MLAVLFLALHLLLKSGEGKAASGIFEAAMRWMRKAIKNHGGRHHVFKGEIRKTKNGLTPTGYHHRFMGRDDLDRRVTVLDRDPHTGVYRGDVQMKGPNGQWMTKPHGSTFFPDNWSPQRVNSAIEKAFASKTVSSDGKRWSGTVDGIVIQGSFKRNGMKNAWDSAWPVMPYS
ncbi:EndoU domain-containing protein [Actinomadura sp. RB99]|uniref:EndoU domain-containing protein n=1 Tax=Actinomadura sp. RB99 TaxID=2691577 RepID=UPI001681F5D0|nr:EndoU domain-containing protein [Actinomadura sp. RB99]